MSMFIFMQFCYVLIMKGSDTYDGFILITPHSPSYGITNNRIFHKIRAMWWLPKPGSHRVIHNIPLLTPSYGITKHYRYFDNYGFLCSTSVRLCWMLMVLWYLLCTLRKLETVYYVITSECSYTCDLHIPLLPHILREQYIMITLCVCYSQLSRHVGLLAHRTQGKTSLQWVGS